MNGKLSIKGDEKTKIIASSVKEILNKDENISRININITDFGEDKKENLRKSIRYYSKMENAETFIDVTVNGEVRNCGKIFVSTEVINKFYELFGKDNVYIS